MDLKRMLSLVGLIPAGSGKSRLRYNSIARDKDLELQKKISPESEETQETEVADAK